MLLIKKKINLILLRKVRLRLVGRFLNENLRFLLKKTLEAMRLALRFLKNYIFENSENSRLRNTMVDSFLKNQVKNRNYHSRLKLEIPKITSQILMSCLLPVGTTLLSSISFRPCHYLILLGFDEISSL